MKIQRVEITGLLGRQTPLAFDLHDDLNILTGRNGSGKTTVLKLLWYIISGNILLALREVPFDRVAIETSTYRCAINRTGRVTCTVEWTSGATSRLFEDEYGDDGDIYINAEDQADELLCEAGSSIFLPTFRRIEGGFTTSDRGSNNFARARNKLEDSLVELSKSLSKGDHVFVSSLSTNDIVSLLTSEYTDLSEKTRKFQQEMSQRIIDRIKEFKLDQSSGDVGAAILVLDEVRREIESIEAYNNKIMQPVEVVRELVARIFKHSGIRLGKTFNFGDAAGAVNSDALSAGEKQMLSFIAYNAFYEDTVFIIDEPELSLHVDWQRQLFAILRSQQSSNQFIIATHSPFIYSKFPDKEICLDEEKDRGESGER